jgi:hypothetical protein
MVYFSKVYGETTSYMPSPPCLTFVGLSIHMSIVVAHWLCSIPNVGTLYSFQLVKG